MSPNSPLNTHYARDDRPTDSLQATFSDSAAPLGSNQGALQRLQRFLVLDLVEQGTNPVPEVLVFELFIQRRCGRLCRLGRAV